MANNIFNFSRVNPLQPYQQSDVLNTGGYPYAVYKSFDPNINERGIDNDFFYRNIKSWMDQVTYFQPYQQGDVLICQWLGVADYTGPTVVNYVVKIIDSEGAIVKQADCSEGAEVGTGSGIYIRSFNVALHDVPEGKYLVQIHKVGLFTDHDYFVITEGIDVKAYHENTMLFRYKHSENAYGIFWETGIEMQLRLHAAFTEIQPGSKFNVYEDQPANLTLLSGVKYREKQLSIGVANNPVPDYMLDKFEEILLCDTLYIDNVLHTRTEGSKLEPVPTDKNPLKGANIVLREKENDTDLVVGPYPPIVCGVAPTAEWFYIQQFTQTTPATSWPIAKYFNGAVNFVSYLNSSGFIGADYINTYFAIDALGNIVLITNDETVYDDYSPGMVFSTPYTGHLAVEVNPLNADTLQVDYTNTIVSTKYVYFWGDGTTTSGTGTSASKTHNYTTGRKYTAHLFWDQVHNLSLDSSDQIITAISGKLPPLTITFNCENSTLRYIRGNIFAIMGGDCSAIQLSGSKITKFAMNDIIRFAHESKDQFASSATIDLQVQTPAAIPSADPGLAFMRSDLLDNGITILTD